MRVWTDQLLALARQREKERRRDRLLLEAWVSSGGSEDRLLGAIVVEKEDPVDTNFDWGEYREWWVVRNILLSELPPPLLAVEVFEASQQ